MKIAITGATGFVGKWILKTYGSMHELIILGRSNLADPLAIEGKSFRYIRTDYSISALVEQLDKDIEGVIHLAAKRPKSQGANEDFGEYLDNIEIASNLFEACRLLQINNIVNISSRSVYGTSNSIPWTEDMRVDPDIFYGVSKATVENIANYYNKRFDMQIKSLRLAQVLGLGERKGFMLMNFIDQAVDKKILEVYGLGRGKREYVYIKDVIDGIMTALEAKDKSGAFNIGTGIATTHRDLALAINEVFENEGNIKFLPEKKEDQSICLMDIGETYRILNWKAKWGLKEALHDIKREIIR